MQSVLKRFSVVTGFVLLFALLCIDNLRRSAPTGYANCCAGVVNSVAPDHLCLEPDRVTSERC